MSNQIITSVILPIRNEENYISQCIESLLKQDYSPNSLEFIFVDGMSTDKTIEILEEYSNKYLGQIKVIKNPNKTVPYAMNIGIKASLGKYIVRLDAHCEYKNDYIVTLVLNMDDLPTFLIIDNPLKNLKFEERIIKSKETREYHLISDIC